MKTATEREQLKALVMQAMISLLEDDVYGSSIPVALRQGRSQGHVDATRSAIEERCKAVGRCSRA